MGTTLKSRSFARRTVAVALICLPLAAASPAGAMLPDKNPVVRDAQAQSAGGQTYRMAPNEPRQSSSVAAPTVAPAPSPIAHAASGTDWGTVAIVSSAGLVILACLASMLLMVNRRRGRGLNPVG